MRKVLLGVTIAVSIQVLSHFANAQVTLASSNVLEDDTPDSPDDFFGGYVKAGNRLWRPPIYNTQIDPLGYGPHAFEIPGGMEKQVQFWVDIYSKYTTQQGVIHDSENIDLVYGVIDFSDIDSNKDISRFLKEKEKQKRVDSYKKKIIESLNKLADKNSAEGLSSEEMKIWIYFGGVNPQAYREAAQSSRVRFQLGQKNRMQSAIYFSGRYLEDMENIFSAEGLPIELTRLVFVESSFNVMARSKVGASGLWQIMPYTARPYKMMDGSIDKRNHPLEATKLAAKLLKYNYKMLESWPLAVTGYNHGPAGVRRMTEQFNTRSISALVQNVRSKVTFGFASRNFYACFLAALEVERNANKYFPKIVWSNKLDAESMKLPITVKYKDFLTWFSGDDKRLQVFNPHINSAVRKGIKNLPAGALVSVPKENYPQIVLALTKSNHSILAFSKASHLGKNKEVKIASKSQNDADIKFDRHKVTRGDTLIDIAKNYKVPVRVLLEQNKLSSPSKIFVGQVLKIPKKSANKI